MRPSEKNRSFACMKHIAEHQGRCKLGLSLHWIEYDIVKFREESDGSRAYRILWLTGILSNLFVTKWSHSEPEDGCSRKKGKKWRILKILPLTPTNIALDGRRKIFFRISWKARYP